MPNFPKATRRRLLAATAGALAGVGGCLGSAPPSSGSTPSIDAEEVTVTLRPGPMSGPDTVTERVSVANVGDRRLSLSGYVLTYDSGESYDFGDLRIEPGGEVRVLSHGTEDYALKTRPPIYVRGAGFESSVLADGHATVSLVAPGGTVVAEREYST